MTEQAADFLESWIAKNVTADDLGEARAAILATECVIEASTKGIMVHQLADDVEDLERIILQAAAHLAEPGLPGD